MPATPHVLDPKPLRDWKIMDPAVGSGHFHVVAFDMLAELYEEERRLAREGLIPAGWATPEEETARTILERNLYGIDIDPRAVQLATLALYLKGVELGLDRAPRIHMIAADAAFMHTAAWKRFVQGFQREPSVRRVLEALTESLKDIREIGSLLQPEVELQRLIAEERRTWEQQAKRGAVQLDLFPEYEGLEPRQIPFEEISDEAFWENLSYRVQVAIDGFLHEARERDELVEQVVAGQAQRGFVFLQFCQRRYDVVCTNPPYMGSGNMGGGTRVFLAKHYAPGKRDLYAAFVLRCLAMAQRDANVAMVTQHSWMFLRSFAPLRAQSEEPVHKTDTTFTGLLRGTSLTVLAHLGTGAFTEVSGDVVSTALFVLRKTCPQDSHRMVCIRAVGLRDPDDKIARLRSACGGIDRQAVFSVIQQRFLALPLTPLTYWLPDRFVQLLSEGRVLERFAEPLRGLDTCDMPRFVRYWWEVRWPTEWRPYVNGGTYRKWAGLRLYAVYWKDDGKEVKSAPGSIVPNESRYSEPGLTFSDMCSGSFNCRVLERYDIHGVSGSSIFQAASPLEEVAAILNCRISSYVLRAISPTPKFRTGYVRLLPYPVLTERMSTFLTRGVATAIALKRELIGSDITEHSFHDVPAIRSGRLDQNERVASALHAVEGVLEEAVFAAYGIDGEAARSVLDETGTPAGWFSLLAGYDRLPPLPNGSVLVWDGLLRHLEAWGHRGISEVELADIKRRLRTLYIGGRGSRTDEDDFAAQSAGDHSHDEDSVVLPSEDPVNPIPTETLLEEVAQKLEIHPISVYWLLKEMRDEEGLVCPPELQTHIADYWSVKLLRMLGHRWPMQDQYEEEQGHPFLDPRWVDQDGILPLTPGAGKQTLMEVMHRYLDAEFGPERGPQVEVEAGSALGWKKGDTWGQHKPTTLERWFEREFFKRHVSQFKRRPIAWHLTSPKGTFQVIVYYHRFDRNRLLLLRSRYVREVLEELRRRIGRAQAAGSDREALGRIEALEEELADVQEFDRRLQRLLEGRDRQARIWCPWKSPEEQPVGWDPDINDGVRVNIAPVQRLGLLKARVLSAKDLKSLLAPEGRR